MKQISIASLFFNFQEALENPYESLLDPYFLLNDLTRAIYHGIDTIGLKIMLEARL